MQVRKIVAVCLFLGCLLAKGYSQTDTGTPSFEALVHVNAYESVDVTSPSLNILITAPLREKGGPIPLSFNISQNAQIYISGTTYASAAATPPVLSTGYFRGDVRKQNTGTALCPGTQTHTTEQQLIGLGDGRGTFHPLPPGLFRDTQNCLDTSAIDAFTTDDSGLELVSPAGSQGFTVYDRTGISSAGTSNITDLHGNAVTLSTVGSVASFMDVLSSTPVLSYNIPNNGAYTYTDGTGTQRTVTATNLVTSMLPAFACSGYTNTSQQFDPLTSVTYPDGSALTLTWEQMGANYDGRLGTLQVPTGAIYTHGYTGGTHGDGLWCPTFGAATMSISNGVGTWTFARNSAGTQTTVTKPDGSKTVYSMYAPSMPVLTGKVVYDTNGTTVLDTWTYCYDSTISNCNPVPPTLQPTWVRAYHYVPGVTNPAETDTKYDSNGNTLEVDRFDFGPTLVAKRMIIYGTYNGSTCVALSHIIGKPCVIQDQDASSTVLTSTAITYTAAGDPQTVYHWNGTTNLTEAFVTNTNGTLSSYTGVDGVNATFTNTQCNGFLPDSATNVIGTVHTTWDCNAAAVATTTDLNSLVTTNTYGDPLYRITQASDNGGQAPITYTYTSPTRFSRDMTFNGGNSIDDATTTLNTLGQAVSVQKRTSPTSSNYDTVSFGYDSTGHNTSTSQACTTTVGGTCANAAITYAYDGLNRLKTKTVNTSTHGVLTYTYPNGDIQITLTPAPTGENAKTVLIEPDALGWIPRVCIITSLPGNGNCGNRATGSGYLTLNYLDALGRPTQISRNAQAGATPLNENYTYDPFSRVTQATVPETGTSHAYFDSVTSTCSTWASSHGVTLSVSGGQLAQTTDNAGNVLCYKYEPAGRIQNAYPISGPNYASTPTTYFYYDGSGGNISGAHLKGRMNEAGTTFPPYTTASSDHAFGYDIYGREADHWQLMSGTSYFHTTASYFDNGGITTLSGIPGVSNFTFGVDSEGRGYSATTGSTAVVSSVSYDPASNPLTVTYGSTDTDTYQWDPNTLNMTQYQFKLNGVTDTGVLTWNPNRTLKTLAITDNLSGSGDTQTCNVAHDDLVRVTTDNCGSLWNETYSWSGNDESNVTKSGTLSFAPGYNSNNQFLAPYTYDANGYLLHDATLGINYTWDANGGLLSAGSATTVNDAFGNMVQKTVSGTNTYYVYSPIGNLGSVAGLNGPTIGVRLPLPGGAMTTFGMGEYIYHTDHNGSARMISNYPARTLWGVMCYGPQGELYCGVPLSSMYQGTSEDTTQGLTDFGPTRYSGTMGRSISPQ